MAVRNIAAGPSRVLPVPVNAAGDLRAWLETLAGEHDLMWLLATCEDGTIWGVMDGGRLALSSEAFPRGGLSLRWAALVQARLFGAESELLLWRGPAGWLARLRDDREGEQTKFIDESQLLWGTGSADSSRRSGPFQELVEGRRGIRHAPPVGGMPTEEQRASLRVRHYLAADDDGVVRVVDGRLMGLEPTGGAR